MELRMSWKLAAALGAVFPSDVQEHREMLRGGSFILVRPVNMGGLAMFWEVAPGIIAKSS